MRGRGNGGVRRFAKFFYVALSHDSLMNLYYTNFALMQHHKYSLAELEDMIPFERQIYVTLLQNYIKEEEQRQKEKH